MNPQGIYTLVSHGKAVQRRMDATANNLANVTTNGYKADQPVFRQVFARTMGSAKESDEEVFATQEHLAPYTGRGTNYVAADDMGKNFDPGRIEHTGNPMDIALTGRDTFFSVQTPQGERFTRAGKFHLSPDNTLVSQEGYTVNGKQGPLRLEGNDVRVSEDGSVYVDGERAGGIKVVRFPQPERLQKLGGAMFAPVDEANAPRIAEDVQMEQGAVESSNVNQIKEMVNMIEANRAYGQMQRALTAADQMNERALSLARTT